MTADADTTLRRLTALMLGSAEEREVVEAFRKARALQPTGRLPVFSEMGSAEASARDAAAADARSVRRASAAFAAERPDPRPAEESFSDEGERRREVVRRVLRDARLTYRELAEAYRALAGVEGAQRRARLRALAGLLRPHGLERPDLEDMAGWPDAGPEIWPHRRCDVSPHSAFRWIALRSKTNRAAA